ncbi:hypothetical protein UlMin_013179 [Ulmus minor]
MILAPILFIITFTSSFLLQTPQVNSLGSSSTAAVAYGSATVCGIVAGETTQRIQCYQNNKLISILPNVSFEAISGGNSFFCGLRNGGFSLLCWDTTNFKPKRIYHNKTVGLTDLNVGNAQVCAREINTGMARCWRGGGEEKGRIRSSYQFPFGSITCGSGFACGILKNNSRVLCWGDRNGDEIQSGFEGLSMSSLVAGESHACGLTSNGSLVCRGNNFSGKLDVPFSSAFEFSDLALGANFTCAIRRSNRLVVCWGGRNRFEFYTDIMNSLSFELIVPGLDFVCGLITRNLTMICWGPGWSNSRNDVPELGMIVPGPCVHSLCSNCGMYPDSEILCGGSGNICKSCQIELPLAVPLPPSQPLSPPPSKADNKILLAFLIVGSVGAFVGFCSFVYFLWIRILNCYRRRNKTSETNMTNQISDSTVLPHSMSISGAFRRQRSGSSRQIVSEKPEIFFLSELAAATDNFSLRNKIGAGSFGIVYKGKLADGREVAIKRGLTETKKFQDRESAFESELALLSRLHHKNLVELVGFCQEEEERLLVYRYMINGSLHDHLHSKSNDGKSSAVLNSWKIRIKIGLDAARGIEYLHNYAVPPIIHRDVKSSNILLDSNWTARVSDFGLSLMWPESDQDRLVRTKAVGTVGYIDPEYYVLHVLTDKSDVYGLGVVLLELLTGKRAVFKNEEEEGGGVGVTSVVEFVTRFLGDGYGGGDRVQRVLDKRVGLPAANEAEAVEVLAYTAMCCVSLEGKERPGVTDIVANLERALSLCEGSSSGVGGGGFSPASVSFPYSE